VKPAPGTLSFLGEFQAFVSISPKFCKTSSEHKDLTRKAKQEKASLFTLEIAFKKYATTVDGYHSRYTTM
jgi:hypothetical protein